MSKEGRWPHSEGDSSAEERNRHKGSVIFVSSLTDSVLGRECGRTLVNVVSSIIELARCSYKAGSHFGNDIEMNVQFTPMGGEDANTLIKTENSQIVNSFWSCYEWRFLGNLVVVLTEEGMFKVNKGFINPISSLARWSETLHASSKFSLRTPCAAFLFNSSPIPYYALHYSWGRTVIILAGAELGIREMVKNSKGEHAARGFRTRGLWVVSRASHH
ncbi:hypothetical protein VNO77_19079 [Canavalia gladiata]|uniref:Uncharacterized protein n=1 Tax=Canavalia gladiata TaxID=3824 RepID=A0AAN9LRX1_CANGL